jgi:PREDICTED: similar to AGAP002097-PA
MCTLRGRVFKRKANILILLSFIIFIVIAHFLGITLYAFQSSLDPFFYPLVLSNLEDLVDQHKSGLNLTLTQSFIKENNYKFLINNHTKCFANLNSTTLNGTQDFEDLVDFEDENDSKYEDIFLVIIVKSALTHRKRRDAIRKTWGYEQRFADIKIRTLFSLGNCNGLKKSDHEVFKTQFQSTCQQSIIQEAQLFNDIIQADFADTYYNNSIKTMMGIKWIILYCPVAHFILLIDDDYYLSVKNLVKYVRNVFEPPDNLRILSDNLTYRYVYDYRLYSGFVFPSSWPIRIKLSKWYLSLSEYPFAKFPPYVTAGAIVLSNSALVDIYYTSLYTKPFRFDDIYLAILAKKIKIKPIHNSNFYFWKKSYTPQGYSEVIASHGYDNPQEMITLWEEQKRLGHA